MGNGTSQQTHRQTQHQGDNWPKTNFKQNAMFESFENDNYPINSLHANLKDSFPIRPSTVNERTNLVGTSTKLERNSFSSHSKQPRLQNYQVAEESMKTKLGVRNTQFPHLVKGNTTSVAEYESHWSDDGDVLAISVPATRDKNNQRRGSNCSLDDNIREIERAISTGSFLDTCTEENVPILKANSSELSPKHRNSENTKESSSDASPGSVYNGTSIARTKHFQNLRSCTREPMLRKKYQRIQSHNQPNRPENGIINLTANSSSENETGEWEYKQAEIEGFDPLKFKAANPSMQDELSSYTDASTIEIPI